LRRLFVSLAAAFLLSAQSSAPQDTFFSGPPFALDDLLQRIGVIADKRLSTAIERRGISFSPTPADFDRLKHKGASAELIKTINDKAPPKPAPPPPPAHAGKVALQCVPAECDVVVNGKPRGKTADGAIELTDLPTGENTIDFRKDGFEGQQLVLNLNAGSSTSQTVTLRPTAATRARLGKQAFDRMIAKLGGQAALQKQKLIAASGSASLFQANGQRTEWQFTSRLKLPSMAMIEISGAKMKWWTSLSADDSKAGGAKQMTGGPVALEMEKLVRVYRDYQPAALVERWKSMNVTTQNVAPLAGQWRFRASNADGAYQISLDPDYTPRRVVYESASGLGSGMEVLYSDFATIDTTAWYPKAMVIKFSAQQQHGLELHFREIEFPEKVVDKEFHR
jgi:hypothetical protein